MIRLVPLVLLVLVLLPASAPNAHARGGQYHGPVVNVPPESPVRPGEDPPPPLEPGTPGGPPIATAARPAGSVEVRRTAIVGGGGGGAFEARAPEGALLVGVRGTTISWAGHEIVRSLQPLYRLDGEEHEGDVFGYANRTVVEALAKPGYAVGALLVKGGHRVDGLRCVFMRVDGDRLDLSDVYTGPWIGGRGGGAEELLGGSGRPVVGLVGRCGADLDAVGLLELGPCAAPPARPPIRLAFSGRVDGSVRLVVGADAARWENLHWGTPDAAVTIGGVSWNPRRSPVLANRGETRYLPVPVDFASARLVKTAGRDAVSLEPGPHAVTVRIADNPNGTDLYEFSLLFDPVRPYAELSLRATVDGSEEIVVTREAMTWHHRHWGWPQGPVLVNDRSWDPRTKPVLANTGADAYLPPDVDLSTARVVRAVGRDLASVDVLEDRLVIHLVDTPVGSDLYEVVIRFGPDPLPITPISGG